jgi:hypothetical protein
MWIAVRMLCGDLSYLGRVRRASGRPFLLGVSGRGAGLALIGEQSTKKAQEGGRDGLIHVGWPLGEDYMDPPRAVRVRVLLGRGLGMCAVGQGGRRTSLSWHVRYRDGARQICRHCVG